MYLIPKEAHPAGIPKLILPQDELLKLSYRVYQPSIISQLLKGEVIRNLVCEAVVNESISKAVLRLRDICKIAIARKFKSGKFDLRLPEEDLVSVGELLNIDLPLENIVDIDIESFWKRVFLVKCTDPLLKCQKIHDSFTNYKIEAVQLNLAEIIETTAYEKWDEKKMNNLAKTIAPYVQMLHVRRMVPMQLATVRIDPSLYDEVCHHGSLEMIGFLENLTKIHIEFLPPDLGREFHMRYFLFSCHDIENFARGLSRLANLNHLSIKRSRLDDEKKIKILFRGLVQVPLETVELSYCELRDNSGLYIADLLHKVKTIRVLELEGNHLGKSGLEPIFYAIRTNQGTLEYLGLARNPVTDDGVYMLASVLAETNQVTHLNLNGIKVSPMGGKYVVDLLRVHVSLKKMEMCCVPLGVEEGDRLIDYLKENKFLYNLEIRDCGLTMEHEYRIRLLLSRHPYFSNTSRNLLKNDMNEIMEDSIVEKKRRIKNPVLRRVNAYIKEKKETLDSVGGQPSFTQPQTANLSLDTADSGIRSHFNRKKLDTNKRHQNEHFIYDSNNFSEKDITKYIQI